MMLLPHQREQQRLRPSVPRHLCLWHGSRFRPCIQSLVYVRESVGDSFHDSVLSSLRSSTHVSYICAPLCSSAHVSFCSSVRVSRPTFPGGSLPMYPTTTTGASHFEEASSSSRSSHLYLSPIARLHARSYPILRPRVCMCLRQHIRPEPHPRLIPTSVRASARASVRASVCGSVRDFPGYSVSSSV